MAPSKCQLCMTAVFLEIVAILIDEGVTYESIFAWTRPRWKIWYQRLVQGLYIAGFTLSMGWHCPEQRRAIQLETRSPCCQLHKNRTTAMCLCNCVCNVLDVDSRRLQCDASGRSWQNDDCLARHMREGNGATSGGKAACQK